MGSQERNPIALPVCLAVVDSQVWVSGLTPLDTSLAEDLWKRIPQEMWIDTAGNINKSW